MPEENGQGGEDTRKTLARHKTEIDTLKSEMSRIAANHKLTLSDTASDLRAEMEVMRTCCRLRGAFPHARARNDGTTERSRGRSSVRCAPWCAIRRRSEPQPRTHQHPCSTPNHDAMHTQERRVAAVGVRKEKLCGVRLCGDPLRSCVNCSVNVVPVIVCST